ncbi:AAA family ATPase [Nocardioides zeae]|uniref:Uncharacterized protein n=1 Tax=Nocardioides zeae TaxID=1457234 RepID=A0AAJ1U396_9ACTN|nr:AAA family ATPase [Nocardioides zeae]MDQ1104703.1 hypothetical protein [Nocardioides zeae]
MTPFPAPHDPTTGTTPHSDLVVVGGVPGAGKSTVIASVAQAPGVAALDPDHLRAPVARRWPAVPPRAYRWAIHTVHTVLVWAAVLTGPRLLRHWPGRAARVLLVHETAIRRTRRRLLLRAAVRRGWRPTLLLVDATRDEAIAGQQARGRVVHPLAFDRHWTRWTDLRSTQILRQLDGAEEPWDTRLAPRGFALPVLVATVGVGALTAQAA